MASGEPEFRAERRPESRKSKPSRDAPSPETADEQDPSKGAPIEDDRPKCSPPEAPPASGEPLDVDVELEGNPTLHIPESLQAPIPQELYSAYEEGPFTKCNACAKPLDGLGLYEIQKVYRGSEVIFETAICHLCGEDLIKELSVESLDAMKGFLICNFSPTSETNHCHFCGFPRGLFENFTVVGACRDSSLLVPQIIMCEKCSETLNERLSQKTRDIQGDFIQDHFPGVPADLDLSPSLGGLF